MVLPKRTFQPHKSWTSIGQVLGWAKLAQFHCFFNFIFLFYFFNYYYIFLFSYLFTPAENMVHSFHWSWIRDRFGPVYGGAMNPCTRLALSYNRVVPAYQAYTSFHLLLYLPADSGRRIQKATSPKSKAGTIFIVITINLRLMAMDTV